MSFTTFGFLAFLIVTLCLLRFIPSKRRWIALLPLSAFFYACLEPALILMLLAVIVFAYLFGRALSKVTGKGKRRLLLALGLSLCLSFLFVCKYLKLFLSGLSLLCALFGQTAVFDAAEFVLPMGISFYSFQAAGYLIDVYRDPKNCEKHLGHFSLFILYFPQLVAGPVERAADLLPQLRDMPNASAEDLSSGLWLILRGYAKKLLIADRLAVFVDQAYAAPEAAGGAALLLATLLFSAQIYCDFSGYTDIAIGCARMMGIRLSRNFDHPWRAASVRDFWRRWHITLSSWLRDYIYIPLGGSRKGLMRQCLALGLVFAVSGLWHGAEWSFLIWGLCHALAIVGETLLDHFAPGCCKKLRRILTPVFLSLSWIFFRAQSLPEACTVFHLIFTDLRPELLLSGMNMTAAGAVESALLLLFLPLLEACPSPEQKTAAFRPQVILIVILALLLLLCRIEALQGGVSAAFIYFRF